MTNEAKDQMPEWARTAAAKIADEAIELHTDQEIKGLSQEIAAALLSAYRRGRESQQTEFVGWIRQWVKKRFGQWITYNTAKGAYADYQAAKEGK